MKHVLSLRARASLSIVAGLALSPSPAQADPISVTVLAILGTQTATALAIAVTTFVLTTVASLVLSFAMTALFGPKQTAQDRQASIVAMSIGESPRQALLGEVATGGSLADAFNDGGPDGTDYETLIIVVADHRCHSLTGFYVGDTYVAFAGNGVVEGYNNQLEVYWLEGTEDQVMPSCVTSFGGWDSESNLAGCAVVVARYKADSPTSKNPIWTAGRPSFLWVIKGALLYLPRKDSSIGGSGLHRWDDVATREWSDNVVDCRYNWVRGFYACDRIDQPGMLLVGRGLSAIEAPAEEAFSGGNTCDEPVALKSGGSEPRYRCSLVVPANEDYIATEEKFAAACAGIIIQRRGGVEIEPGSARSVVAEITDADFIVGEKRTFNRFRTDTQRVNTVVPRYIEPEQRWADHAAPLRRVLADLAEDGGPREETLSLNAVTSGTQAQRCGEIRRRMARLERTFSGTLGPRFAHLEEGDWIGFTSERYLLGARVVFRIDSYSLSAAWRNTISISEIAASCFSWAPATDEITPGAVAVQQTPPDLTYGLDRAAYKFLSQTNPQPLASTASTVTITGFSGVLDDNRRVDLPSGSVTGLLASTNYAVFFVPGADHPPLLNEDGSPEEFESGGAVLSEETSGTFAAYPWPALAAFQSSDNVFIGWQVTAAADGTFPAPIAATPGYGGAGSASNVFQP